jgi:hypothetical protein
MYKEGNNILRKQKIQIALFDEDMNVYEVVEAMTSSEHPVTLVADLIGKQKPYAYFLNYNLHGYAIIKVDDKSLIAFDHSLHLIKDEFTRK